MKDEKLIKKLRMCGFKVPAALTGQRKKNSTLLESTIKGVGFCYDTSICNFYSHKKRNVDIYDATFAQIAEKVLELTGVTLTPKQTKRQEIDKNKSEAHRANDRISCLSRRTDRELKWALKRIDALEQGNQSQAQMIEDLQKSYAEPKGKPEKTEGVFKVGDPVVLNPTIDFSINSIKLEAAAQTVFTVSGTNTNCFYLSKNGKPFFKDILFYQCELLNAPIKRIFETGDRVVVKPRNTYAFGCSDSKRNKAKCSTILIIHDICGNNSVAGGLEIETNDGRYTVGELQHAPKEAAKVLEFGGWAETLVQMDSIDIGQRVLIVSNPDVDGEFLCTSGVPENSEHYDPEQLKAL
jgi:hypothetical protein